LATEGLTESLDTLGFASSSWSVGVTSVTELHSHDKGKVALVCQWGVDELGGVALVLVGVFEEGIAHAYHALATLLVHVVPELLIPQPVCGVLRPHDLSVFQKLFSNVNVVNHIQNESLDFVKKQEVSLVLKNSEALKLFLQVASVVLKLALFDGCYALI